MWTARRILKELADTDRRRAILVSFWKYAEPSRSSSCRCTSRKHCTSATRRSGRCRRRRKTDLLATTHRHRRVRAVLRDGADAVPHALRRTTMLAAFLVSPGTSLTTTARSRPRTTRPQRRAGARCREGAGSRLRPRRHSAFYLATAGLLNTDGWREAMWPGRRSRWRNRRGPAGGERRARAPPRSSSVFVRRLVLTRSSTHSTTSRPRSTSPSDVSRRALEGSERSSEAERRRPAAGPRRPRPR